MRLHHLEITAFGPFAETVAVDFDELSAAGLFLLSGPTGAGKTSVLDAVCFALYGDVPGDRSAARRFRSDGAAPGVAPRVVLEVTLAGRRFRLSRSPQWRRPKRRGAGETTEQASVLVEERVEGLWQPLSTRLDEAGHLVTDLVGMNLPQFCQVAMLPQGRFQAFLRARSEDRHRLLQQLFSTERFEQVERWLRDHARALRRESAVHGTEAARVVHRLLEVGAEPLDDAVLEDLEVPAEDGSLHAWAVAAGAAAALRQEETAARRIAAAAVDDERERALADARRVEDARRRHHDATDRLAALDEDEPAQRERRRRLERSRAAATVVPLRRLADAAARRHDTAATAVATADEVVVRAGGPAAPGAEPLDEDTLHATLEAARSTEAEARLLLPREAERDDVAREAGRSAAELAGLESLARRLAEEVRTLPGHVEQLETARQEAEDAGARCAGLTAGLADLDRQLAAHAALAAARSELETARAARDEAVATCQDLREQWLDLREARIQGMAAELAHGLAVGHACPVCGSPDHPHKAVPSAGAPTASSEKSARRRLDDAEGARTAHDARVHDLTTGVAVLEREAGPDGVDDLRARRARVAADLAADTAAADRVAALAGELDTARTALEEARTRLAEVGARQAAVGERLTAQRSRLAALEAELDEALAGTDKSLAELAAGAHALADACAVALRARDSAAAARREAEDAEQALVALCAERGFTDPADALAALLDDSRAAALEQAVADHDRARQLARSTLDDPEVRAAAARPAVDLPAAERAHAEAREAHAEARAEHDRAARVAARTGELAAELDTVLEAWAPLREAHRTAAGLAALVEGTSADNAWRMRLSAYVLAWRLGQVVAAANERLQRMSDRRYTLEHTGQRGAGERRGGLSLLVRDAWSGEARDPATLSGGETFVVSLALALGLADVVGQEAGGNDLDTLFVDEGFGALDADTLDDVMDVLDGLRDGGRVVGVVSHVGELRTRIPVQLAVSKQRSGSTLEVQHVAS